jgi:SsrA-binding protein
VEVVNRRAPYDYFIGEKFSAGLLLRGTEVKSFRAGRAQIGEAHVRIGHDGRPWLYRSHIEAYSHGTDANHDPYRPRALLLHGREIEKLRSGTERKGMAIVPLRMYLHHGLVKLDIALAKGKRLYDKRQDLKRATAEMEAARARRHGAAPGHGKKCLCF